MSFAGIFARIFSSGPVVSSRPVMKKLLPILLSLLALNLPAEAASDYNLPGFGEGNAVSLNQEYYLGRAWLMSFRRQAPIVSDALLQDYVENMVYRLVVSSQLRERRLEIVLVKNSTINAFAVPGGIVGIHTGLIAKAENESQFASVIAHELAHLSQRHFARGLEAQKKSSAASLAGLLGGLVAIAAGAGDAGMAAVMGGQAASQSSQLSYSRQYEQEADRVGIQNLAAAGFDPGGSAGMFDVMLADSRNYGARPPEFLLTHPVTEKRIADAKNRANTYPHKIYPGNPEFQLMRARVEYGFFDNSEKAVAAFRDRVKKGGKNAVANQYGLILALTANEEFAEARKLLQPMREFRPNDIVYLVAEANIDISAGQFEAAIAMLEQGLARAPGNHPITMSLARALYEGGYYEKADRLLSKHVRGHASDANLWYLLAEVQGKSGNILGLHQSRAEYFALNGAMKQAIEQLKLALPLAQNNVTVERIYTRIDYFENIERALGSMG